MTEMQTLVLGRVLERLLIVMAAASCVAMGWNLFKLRIVRNQEAEFSGASWAVKLSRVGPGVFFALFGAGVLGVALARPLDVQLNPSSNAAPTVTAEKLASSGERSESDIAHVNYAGPQDRASMEREVAAINTVSALLRPAVTQLEAAESTAAAKAVETLQQRRRVLLRQLFGDAHLDAYEAIKAKAKTRVTAVDDLPAAERAQYDKVEAVAAKTFIGEL